MIGQAVPLSRIAGPGGRALVPIGLALGLSAAILAALGSDPVAYFGYVAQRGLFSPSGLQATLTRMAPLLLLAASLILAFRAGLWNLGIDGQFLLGAVGASALAPGLAVLLPWPLGLAASALAAALIGALWIALPALLRVCYGINEIISTLMMSLLGISLANLLVKTAFADPGTTVPQTMTLAVADRLPKLFGTTVGSGLLMGVLLVILVDWVMVRTSFGLRLRVIGASSAAARHAGLPVRGLVIGAMLLSAALAGLAGAVEVLGTAGNVRADWNPAYGLVIIPLVLLARLRGIPAIILVFLMAMLQIGGESAARRLGVPQVFTLVLMGFLLIAMPLVERLASPRQPG